MKDLIGWVCAHRAQGVVRQHGGNSWASIDHKFMRADGIACELEYEGHSKTSAARPRASRESLKQERGEKILVIEDAFLLGELVCDFLHDCGMEPVGPADRLQEGCDLAREGALDGAILDVKLREGLSFPIAAILQARRIPFIFVTGYRERSQIPPEFRSAPLVCKPFEDDELGAALSLILGRPAADRPLVPLLAGQAPAFDAGRLTSTVSAKA